MTDEYMSLEDTKLLLGILRTAYPKFYSAIGVDSLEFEDTISLWHLMLSDTPLQTAKIALYKLIATCKFPPSISEMRECIASVGYIAVLDAGDAWAEVNRAIVSYGYYREREALASMSEATRKAVACIGWQTLFSLKGL